MPSETEVPPTVSSGLARRKGAIVGGLAFLTVVYRLIVALDLSSFHRPDDKFCPPQGGTPCSRPDLFAFQVCSGIMQVYMGVTGFVAWHATRRARTAVPDTPEGRLFGYIEEADRLNAGIFVYQLWDLCASLTIPEHATFVFLSHHALAAITALFSLEHQLVHHYAIFFGGCSEISSIFLVLCDYDVYFPADRGSLWGAVVLFCQASFALSFLYYRIVAWFRVSVDLWRDALYALDGGVCDKFRPGKAWFLRVFLVMDVCLGSLQVYWFGFGIVPKIVEILSEG